jgi:hypothetical protein
MVTRTMPSIVRAPTEPGGLLLRRGVSVRWRSDRLRSSLSQSGQVASDASGTPRCRRRLGQVAVEWLMVAGILTAVAIIIVGLIQPVLVEIVRYLARSVRMVGV